MKIIAIYLNLFLVLLSIINCNNILSPINASKGVLNLQNKDFAKEGITTLDGEWIFYWNKLIYTEPDKQDYPLYVPVPSTWNTYQQNGSNLTGIGYGTYRLKLLVNHSHRLGLKIPDQGTAFSIYINGSKKFESGTVSSSKEKHNPSLSGVILELEEGTSSYDILIQISNHEYSRGGFWQSIWIGRVDDLHKEREKIITLDLFITGCFVFMGLYNLIYYLLKKNDKALLYFSIYSILISIRLILVGERYLVSFFPAIPYELAIRAEYFSYYFAVSTFSSFLFYLYPEEAKIKIYKFFQYTTNLLSLGCFFLPLFILTASIKAMHGIVVLFLIYGSYIIIRAILNHRHGAKIYILGFAVFTSTIVNDILINIHWINSVFLSSYGFLVFNFLQAVILARRFSLAFLSSEILKENLEKSNKELLALKTSLEMRVLDRTRDLEKLNEFSKIVNSTNDLERILSEIHKYMIEVFNLDSLWLILYDKEKRELFTYSILNKVTLTEEHIGKAKALRISADEKNSIYFRILFRKKPFHSKGFIKAGLSKDQEIINITLHDPKYSLEEIVLLPLYNGDEPVGIMNLTSYERKSNIKLEDLKSIARFGDQVAGAIKSSYLTQVTLETQRKLAKIGEMASGIVHDLKNPMAAIKLYAELSDSARVGKEKRQQYLETISLEIDRLSDMTYEILDFTKEDFYLNLEEVDVAELIFDLARFLKADYESKKILVQTNIDYTGKITIDMDRIRRALLNLITNAGDALLSSNSKEEKRIIIRVFLNEEFVIFQIEDNGHGIPPEIQNRIFDNFFTHGKAKGTGIGLFMVKSIIEAHKGKIAFQSEIGKGTTFTVQLPLKPELKEEVNTFSI